MNNDLLNFLAKAMRDAEAIAKMQGLAGTLYAMSLVHDVAELEKEFLDGLSNERIKEFKNADINNIKANAEILGCIARFVEDLKTTEFGKKVKKRYEDMQAERNKTHID